MVYCSRKCQIFSTTICALIWAAVFIVAMLVPYIILQAQNQGVEKLIKIDRDTWTQKQWDNYTVSTLNMSYYIWNATNLDAVMKDSTGATLIKWQEVGPINISKISHMEVLSGESASSGSPYIRYRKLTTYKISDEESKKFLSKPIVAVNTLWVGALSKAAQALYAGYINTQPLTPQQKLEAIRGDLYLQAFNKESLFYGVLTQGLVSGAAVQFTALKDSGFTPESALIPALRILSVGEYLKGALTALGTDPAVRSYLALGAADAATTRSALIQRWAAGQTNRSATMALQSTSVAVRLFQDFELPGPINATSIAKVWNPDMTTYTNIALTSITGLKNWAYAMQCAALNNPTKCNPQQLLAFQTIAGAYTSDFATIAGWLGSPLSVNLLDTTNTIKPDFTRKYTIPVPAAGPNAYLYYGSTPAERFQQIVVTGFEKLLSDLSKSSVNKTTSTFDQTTQYAFAPSVIGIGEVDGSKIEQAQAEANTKIKSFYDLTLLQYATGLVVSLALPGLPEDVVLRGLTVSKNEVLGATAGFGGQLNIENEPIEFSSAVQLVDPTLPIRNTRLTVQQARGLLSFIQGLVPTMTATNTTTPALIAFTLCSEATIRFSQQTLFEVFTDAQKNNNLTIQAMLGPYLQLRTSAVFEGIEKLSATFPTNPNYTLPYHWAKAQAYLRTTQAAAFLPALPAFMGYAGINPVTLSNLRPFVAYFHSYFRLLQGGVGPNAATYTFPGATRSVDEEYNPVFGTSRRTNGLFIQRTVFEFLFGSRSHIPGQELKPILDPVTSYLDEDYRQYDNGAIQDGASPTPGANKIMLSAAFTVPYAKNTLEEAKRRNAIVYTGQDTAINTGRMDINAVGQYHLYNGITKYNSICQYNNPGGAPEMKADENSRLPGEILRSACVVGSPADYKVYEENFEEVIGDRVNDPSQFQPFREGDSNILPVIGTFITEVARTVTFNYTGTTQIKGINLRRYQLDSKYLNANDAPNNPYKNAIYRQTEKPGYYPATPDGMVSGWYYLGAPIFVSKPHFYQVSPQITSAFAPGSFSPQVPIHETYLDVDALSGKTMHARKRLQANVYVSKDTIDASPHLEPIFKSGDKFFPYYWAQEAGTITDEDAETFKDNIYKARDIGRIVQIVVGVISAILFVICVALVVRSCTKTPDATTTDK